MAKKQKAVAVDTPPLGTDHLDLIPPFLRRAKSPPKEDMDIEPVLKVERTDNVPHAIPPNADGMNMIELYLTDGGRRRYLVVRVGNQNVQLLHLPTLEHIEADLRGMNEQVTSGMAHWYELPPNLADRLIDKSVQLEMYRMRYSRALVSEALTNLGRPPLPDPEPLAKAQTDGTLKPKSPGGRKAGTGGPGIIDTIIAILQGGGGTVDEIYVQLHAKFPDRGEGMKGTIKTQLRRLKKQGRLDVKHEGARFYADPVDGGPAPKPVKNDYADQLKHQESIEKEYTGGTAKLKKAVPKKTKSKAKAKKKG